MSSSNDEALARALQEEYEREFQRSQRREQQQSQQPSLPPARNPGAVPSESSRSTHSSRARSSSRSRRSHSQPRQQQSQRRSSSRTRISQSVIDQQQSVLNTSTTVALPPPTAMRPAQPVNVDTEAQRREQEQRDYELARRMGSRHYQPAAASAYSRDPEPVVPAVQDADAAYAMRVEQELRDEELARRMMQRTSSVTQAETPVTGSSSSSQDEDYARRLEQELRDEDIARRLRAKEQEAVSRRQAASMATTRQGCTPRKVIRFMIPVFLMGGLIGFLLYYFVFNGAEDIPDWFLPDYEDFAKEDPFNATTPDNADRWDIGNQPGLQLEVVNSLDSDWYDIFNRAVSEWDSGSPDALDLTVSTRTPDDECRSITGKLKVCNGDYGGTNWRGINQIALNGPEIVASVALMNEYYLNRASPEQRQYTMCHEIGHGFGLPHTDENFYNSDKGECMDYTTNPANNQSPGPPNFIFLRQLYGLVPGGDPGDREVVPEDVPAEQEDEDEDDNNQRGNQREGNRRGGNRRATETTSHSADQTNKHFIPWDEIIADHARGMEGWRLIHKSRHGELHEKEVEDGHVVRVQKLLAPESGLRG